MTLQLSLTFTDDPQSSIHTSFSQASTSYILPLRGQDIGETGSHSDALGGAVVGCEDGSLYLFHALRSSVRAPSVEALSRKREASNPASTASSTSHTPRHPRRHLRSSSPRSHSPASVKSPSFSPFHVTKSTVVSSVSAEQVEAPKNYVDFEDEQEKLKGMIKRKGGVKDRTMVDALMPGGDKVKPLGQDKCHDSDSSSDESPSKPRERKTDLKVSTSANLSSASSVRSLSTPSTPSFPPTLRLPDASESSHWALISHSLSPFGGAAGAVTSVKHIPGHQCSLALCQSGIIGVYSTEDGTCLQSSVTSEGSFAPPSSGKAISKLPIIWHWKALHLAAVNDSFLVLACASSVATTSTISQQDLETGEKSEETRIAAFELRIERKDDPGSVALTKIGEWAVDGPVHGIALHAASDGQLTLLHVDASSHVVRQKLTLVDGPPTPEPAALEASGSNAHLPLPSALKTALKGFRSSENLADVRDEDIGRIVLVNALDLGLVPLAGRVQGLRLFASEAVSLALAWSSEQISIFDVGGTVLRNLGGATIKDIRDVVWQEKDVLVFAFDDHTEIRDLVQVDLDNNPLPAHGSGSKDMENRTTDFRIRRATSYPAATRCAIATTGDILATRTKNGRQRLQMTNLSTAVISSTDATTHVVWKPRREAVQKTLSVPRITAILPLELDHIVLGYSDGHISQCSFGQLVRGAAKGAGPLSDIPLDGRVSSLSVAKHERAGEHIIIGGGDDGSIAIWSLRTLKMLARWTVFTEPLSEVICLTSGRLKECIFCISRDGTIAVVALDGFQFLFLVPASVAPLRRVCIGEDNLLLLYADNRSRLWDTRTREFWRSMSGEKADEMLKQGGWTDWTIPSPAPPNNVLTALHGHDHSVDAGATLVVDIEAFLAQHASVGAKAAEAGASAKRGQIAALLSALVTFGASDEIDRVCRDSLGLQPTPCAVGFASHGAVTVFTGAAGHGAWSVSSTVSAARATGVISVAQALAQLIEDAHTVSAFYTASLAHSVGLSYKPPNLTWLARLWLQATVPELRNAARTRFDVGVARLLDEEIAEVVDSWQPYLPCVQPDALKESVRSALALFICGSIAIEKYTLLHTTCLTEISKSIALYLHDERSAHRALAIDLCSRGFPVWQQYVDAVEMLRALFALATAARRDAAAGQAGGTQAGAGQVGVGQAARAAVLHIAAGNTPLFMTTVSMDILHPKSVQHRKSVMQLVIFLIHKRPLVLYSNLPRLIEAVVKSLDPSSNADRDAVLDAATEILGHIVDSYPTVDFHGPTQRLAVGTSEGAVVMYDLKTATRLYVLEGHARRTTAVSFAPDGRRLVTLSLEDAAVAVWKVGAGFASFFNPGAPPRQGAGGSAPYKTFAFNIGDEGVMSIGATLELVKFEWVSDRSVKVKIRGVTLTFST